jgi:PTS system nitrogen regulatory IIA component
MELYQCISPADVILGMKARDRWEALRELLDRVFPARGDEHEEVLSALYDAEGCRCSAVGRSVIVAHAVTGAVRGLKVVFGRSARSIPWDAPDGRMVNLLWLLIHSPAQHDAYLEVLSQTVRLCRCDRHRNELLAAPTTAEVLSVISRAGCARPGGSDTHGG